MGRLIDADEAKKVLLEERVADDDPNYADAWECNRFLEAAVAGLDDLPTVDAVEVVRCKDCKYYGFWGKNGVNICERWTADPYEASEPKEGDFCSYAERRDDQVH